MTNHLINTTVSWLKYNGKIIDNDLLEDNELKIIRKIKISIKEYKKIYKEIGYKYNWIGRLKIKETELKKIIHNSLVEIYLMKKNNKIIGFLEMDYRSSKEIKIVHLGLLESYIGKGYGKKLLQFAIERAKKLRIQPLILQTNSLDHPNALLFYQKNGFQVYSRRNT
ncbi:GNAT family N-acetyltransferase, partial [OCS116 cluster bacterium]|nr:GNAT family N-acetyltransferase [OCS116 cluster bacterium]